jgi:aspartate aminotransferase
LTVLTYPIARRVRELQESPTLAISAKAKALRAAGEDVIDFGAGEPDFATPAHVVEAAQRACADPAMHHYTGAAGLPALREAIAAATAAMSGRAIEPAQVLVTNGGKHALLATFATLVDEGDEVLLPAPYWVTYPEQVRLAGGVPVELATTAADGYRVTVEQLEAARTPRTKLLVFVSPSNPTGAVYPPEEIAAIGRWAAEHGIWVVADEIYEHLVYGDARHVSIATAAPEVAERTVVINGVAKTYAMTGWRVGWAIAPAPLIKRMADLQSQQTGNVANVSQSAAIAALRGPQDLVEQMRATYDRRRKVAHDAFAGLPGVACPLPEGAFYVFPDVSGVLGRGVGGTRADDAAALCAALLEHAKVALVPGEAFGAPGHLRLSYALDDTDLERGLARIVEALG